MSDTLSTPHATPLSRGQYSPAKATDIRGPCPILNSLANHGYLPRDGRNAHLSDFEDALKHIGISRALAATFSHAILLERETDGKPKERSAVDKIWYFIQNPWALVLAKFGVRKPGQEDSMGQPCIDLDQLSTPRVIEHDISLTRHDYAQGDNHTMQPELLKELLSSSSDGGKTLTDVDLAAYRRRRITEQIKTNLEMDPGAPTNKIGNGEISLLLDVFGDGKTVKSDYVRAIFAEERLPIEEGWQKKWSTIGLVHVFRGVRKIGAMIGN